MKLAVIISPNWGDYADKYLRECLLGLKKQSNQNFDIFLVDNGSTDESFESFRQLAINIWGEGWSKRLRFLSSSDNLGFAGGSNLALKIILNEDYEYAVLFNMDGYPAVDCLEQLVKLAIEHPQAGAVQARIMLTPDKHLVNSLGNVTHFLGFGYCNGYRQTWQVADIDKYDELQIAYPSGAAVLLKISALRAIGLFDEEYWMYNEDQDLGWRLWLNGWQVLLSSQAVFYHHYEFSRSIVKFYWMDRNRLISIFKHYSLLTLLLVLPAVLVIELAMLFSASKGGWLKEKLKVWYYFLAPSTWKYLIKARQESISLRKVNDKKIIKLFSARLDYQEVASPALSLANVFLTGYFWLIKFFIR